MAEIDEIAVRTVASRLLRTIVEASLDRDGWGEMFEEISDEDWALVQAEIERLAALMDVSDYAYQTSLDYLEARADAR